MPLCAEVPGGRDIRLIVVTEIERMSGNLGDVPDGGDLVALISEPPPPGWKEC
ncbi:hypothetical protein [Jannaschia seohaensis]|uniref:Uncharacterized protein n=1 Tax=Jannaschia seohaensis TaxID=475081 RepID=A0A2Y9A2U1_9RHOB|nr:hypothetical protein [Jannaschia seohaensis]PWJ21918.1 hypothetical protein BCF38_101327 [Jannaschia seohaensis]SSA38196.1 hypothetical protein SAMN05421539_101327 [Jannaschia seohaensis]